MATRQGESKKIGRHFEEVALQQDVAMNRELIPGAVSVCTRFQRQDVFGIADYVTWISGQQYFVQVCDSNKTNVRHHERKMWAARKYIIPGQTLELATYKLPKLAPNSMKDARGFDLKNKWHGPRIRNGKVDPNYLARTAWNSRVVITCDYAVNAWKYPGYRVLEPAATQ